MVTDAGVALDPGQPADGPRVRERDQDQDLERDRDRDRPGSPLDALARWADPLALGAALLPLVVAAAVLVVGVGGRYLSASDLALEELAVRDVGRHPVLVGLHSRGNWSHPGPLLSYLLAPFYWVTGGRSIGLDLGALAINGASVAGMAWVARRHGGTPLLLCTLAACALVMRTAGADFLHDPWVCFVTTLPFGLLVLLCWSLACGERRALPAAAFVASFLTQTHVGFVALAPPLLLWGAAWLLVPGWRRGDPQQRRDLLRTALLTGGVLVVVWSPLLVDALLNSPSNTGNVWRWFGDEEEFGTGLHTVGDGWRVMTGQFHLWPEWVAGKLHAAFPMGESALMYDHGLPWLLLPLALAVVVAGRAGTRRTDTDGTTRTDAADADGRRSNGDTDPSGGTSPGADAGHGAGDTSNGAGDIADGGAGTSNGADGTARTDATGTSTDAGGGGDPLARAARPVLLLAGTLALTLVLGMVAVARTVGPVFDYRLRWTWMPPVVAFALTAWVAWLAVRRRWPAGERRWLVPAALVLVVTVSGANVVSAASTGTPYEGDSEIVASLTEQVGETLDPDGDQVVIEAPFTMGMWWSRGLVLHLERQGIEVRVPEYQSIQYEHGHQERRYRDGPVQAWLHVVRDDTIDSMEDLGRMELVARWTADEPTGALGAQEVAVFRDLSLERRSRR